MSDGIPPFRTAFQPIVDVDTGTTLAQEALVRGPNGEGAASVLAQITLENRYRADAALRRGAIATALRLRLPDTPAFLTLNIYPGSISGEFSILTTLAEAETMGFPTDRLIFEISETEPVADIPTLTRDLTALQRRGVRIALDDVGTGEARLPLMLAWRPDGAKLAREVIMGLDTNAETHARVTASLAQLASFGIAPVVEGIETIGEMKALRSLGIRAMQGYLFARPGLDRLPDPVVPTG